jgi:hypothetical protein
MTTKEQQELTIQDMCLLEGAASVAKRYADHLHKHVGDIIVNYDGTDFDRAAFLADVAYALDNINVVVETAETIKGVIKAMRAEVSEIFNSEEDEQ